MNYIATNIGTGRRSIWHLENVGEKRAWCGLKLKQPFIRATKTLHGAKFCPQCMRYASGTGGR